MSGLTSAGGSGRMIRTAVHNRGIRYYEAGDAPEIVRLFFETVRLVNRADYSDEQLEAWAAGVHDPEEWHARMAGRRTLVAEEGGEVVGFAELEAAAFMATFASILIFEVGDQGRGLIAWFFTCPLAFIHRPAKRSLRGKHRGVKQAGVTEALF